MEYRIDYADAAVLEIDQAYLWLDRNRPKGGIEWYKGLHTAINSLSQMPYRYAEAPKFGKGVRRLLYGKYLVLYIVIEPDTDETMGAVRVLHVVHGAREVTNADEAP